MIGMGTAAPPSCAGTLSGRQAGRRAAGQGPRVLSIAVVLNILRGDPVVPCSGPE